MSALPDRALGPVIEGVQVEGIQLVYGRTRALAGVDLSLEAGAVTALVGPNGAGKSSLLSVLATLQRPTRGEVRFQLRGGDTLTLAEADAGLRAAIGWVSHSALIYPQLSALENLRFFAELYQLPARAVEAQLEAVGLHPSAWSRPAATYSRGMLQRLALARALLPDPSLLLLDEPFTGLDREAGERLSKLILGARGQGRAVLLVTHDLDAAARLSDRVVLLARGRVATTLEGPVDPASLGEAMARASAAGRAPTREAKA